MQLAVGQFSPACDGALVMHNLGQIHQVHILSISTQEVNLLARAQTLERTRRKLLTGLGKPVLVCEVQCTQGALIKELSLQEMSPEDLHGVC